MEEDEEDDVPTEIKGGAHPKDWMYCIGTKSTAGQPAPLYATGSARRVSATNKARRALAYAGDCSRKM